MEQSRKSYEANSDLLMYALKRPIFKLVIASKLFWFLCNSIFSCTIVAFVNSLNKYMPLLRHLSLASLRLMNSAA